MSDTNNTLSCVGMIMDGNRRWAREQGVPKLEGHRKGYEKLREAVEWCKEENINHLVVYAFSTENWEREEDEVGYLMGMMRKLLKDDLATLRDEGSAIHIVGDLARFPEDIQELIQNLHDTNPADAVQHLWVAASYGGRAEILAGVNRLLKEGKDVVDEVGFSEVLWTACMPDPEVIIRTGGKKRLSNFLTWSSVYSELFFIDTFWPAFSKGEFLEIVNEYKGVGRNFGK